MWPGSSALQGGFCGFYSLGWEAPPGNPLLLPSFRGLEHFCASLSWWRSAEALGPLRPKAPVPEVDTFSAGPAEWWVASGIQRSSRSKWEENGGQCTGVQAAGSCLSVCV